MSISSRIRHRLRAHQAALRLADQLGHPETLAGAVRDTEVRIEEDEVILAIVEDELPDEPPEEP